MSVEEKGITGRWHAKFTTTSFLERKTRARKWGRLYTENPTLVRLNPIFFVALPPATKKYSLSLSISLSRVSLHSGIRKAEVVPRCMLTYFSSLVLEFPLHNLDFSPLQPKIPTLRLHYSRLLKNPLFYKPAGNARFVTLLSLVVTTINIP